MSIFLSRGSALGRPTGRASAWATPWSRAVFQLEIREEYRPSRRSSAPLPTLSSCSYSCRIRALYAAEYRRAVVRSCTCGSEVSGSGCRAPRRDVSSRLRHFVTNVRTFATDQDDELIVESAVLLFRSRGDVGESALVSAGREDLLRQCDGEWKLARRLISTDESVIRMQNLAIFL
ncbi:aromatic-ring-hydroxylating dioxygenase subunit beta [Microtetraspora sp. AC03309]|uniref:aromatic-ring-hydroxylating dioxygenase subunit beta n=1 Tax=Microtetraspora sp. AC03309 TaxID=2779376 RepID=UPI0027E0C305|nr:aromatic-ring-hydroxylating dioxygenase subunit beta [Microtetraspora sp. AC03309]